MLERDEKCKTSKLSQKGEDMPPLNRRGGMPLGGGKNREGGIKNSQTTTQLQ